MFNRAIQLILLIAILGIFTVCSYGATTTVTTLAAVTVSDTTYALIIEDTIEFDALTATETVYSSTASLLGIGKCYPAIINYTTATLAVNRNGTAIPDCVFWLYAAPSTVMSASSYQPIAQFTTHGVHEVDLTGMGAYYVRIVPSVSTSNKYRFYLRKETWGSSMK